MDSFDLYKDIATRTGGDIYVGVVGPVRTGKSTFIKRFMENLVLPQINDKNIKQRAIDEMPQSADGKTIMTTQPKFVPEQAVRISINKSIDVNVRMIDCVGYLVEGAMGHTEGNKPRSVRTPWSKEEMPFEHAAELGTFKVITEHSTIGVVVTSDGSITEIARPKYIPAEERVIKELSGMNKPFVVVLNSRTPKNPDTLKLRDALEERYKVPVVAVDVLNMSMEDITSIMERVLLEFPLMLIEANMPRWMQVLEKDSDVIMEIMENMDNNSEGINKMSDYKKFDELFKGSDSILPNPEISLDMGKGSLTIKVVPKEGLFFNVLTSTCGTDIEDDYSLLKYVKYMKDAEKEYSKIKDAMNSVKENGYGVVMPTTEDMILEEPELVKQGNRFGVSLKASAPSLHIMKVDVMTEINPIVGTEQQGEDLVKYLLDEFEDNKQGIWETNMFGKSLNLLVKEGLSNKLHAMPQDAQLKLRKTLGRIINEGKGGVICILL
ncbi:MAG: stage IV sporulation protein A [Christensenellales bacterium]|jgi:stage IV sporulation protein A